MFHAGGYKGSRGRSTAFSGKNPSNPNKPDWKRPLRCGIQFCTLSCIFVVVGVVLTCLGIHDVFGETVPITGPILLTVGTLFLVLASRQFYLAHSRKKLAAINKEKEKLDSKKTAVVDTDDGMGPSTILMENTDSNDTREKDGLTDSDHQPLDPYSKKFDMDASHTAKNHTSFESGTYIWPTLPNQPSPLACISMMLGKNPAALYGLYHGKQNLSYAYSPGTTSTSLSPSRPDNSISPTSQSTDSGHIQQQVFTPSASPSDPPLQLHSPSQPFTPGTVAVVEASSTSSDSHKPAHTNDKDSNSRLNNKVPHEGLPAMIARDGIHNFPNCTAIMMLRTLELQETI